MVLDSGSRYLYESSIVNQLNKPTRLTGAVDRRGEIRGRRLCGQLCGWMTYYGSRPENWNRKTETILARVYDFTLHGWPPLLLPYFSHREEFSVDQDCVLWGLRVVISGMYRDRLRDDLHQEHHRICHMNSLARGYLWWLGLDADIAQRVCGCQVCASVGKLPPKAPLHPWKWPVKPWERIHIDFFKIMSALNSYYRWL